MSSSSDVGIVEAKMKSNVGLTLGGLFLGIAAGLLFSLIISENSVFWISAACCGFGIGLMTGWLETNK